MRARPSGKRSFGQVWGAPIALGVLGSIGLVSALIGDGFYDAASWATLGLPVLVIIWAIMRRTR
ncbi:hypothetical protein [Iodidimonas sp. SYSU 1G8]|uniref:hypothetical protein n=1 Tax=Iodidimonas sp. SYSU 1G8 TaxID=3133967 RepID=UPI0031FE887F